MVDSSAAVMRNEGKNEKKKLCHKRVNWSWVFKIDVLEKQDFFGPSCSLIIYCLSFMNNFYLNTDYVKND